MTIKQFPNGSSFYIGEDIFTTTNPYILHGVNTCGVMGAGIAKTIKNKYPHVYDVYREKCKEHDCDFKSLAGTFDIVATQDSYNIVNLYTQDLRPQIYASERNVSYDAVDESVKSFFSSIYDPNKQIRVSIPMIGAGIGGGNFLFILNIFLFYARKYNIVVDVYFYTEGAYKYFENMINDIMRGN